MSRFEKLIRRIKALKKDLTFEELKKVLEFYSYTVSSSKGSHRTFRKQGEDSVTIPEESPVKRPYVVLVRDIIENEEK